MNEKIIQKITASHIPVPMCIVSSTGKVLSVNEHISEVFPYSDIADADFFQITGVKISELMKSDREGLIIERNGRKFRVLSDDEVLEDGSHIVFFSDVTNYEDLRDRYEGERICVARISVDNYDEFTDAVSPETGTSVSGQVDRIIREWASNIGGMVSKVRNTLYVVHFHGFKIPELKENKFAILDEVRAIGTGADFPLTLSMGIGVGGWNVTETNDFAVAALDLALSRGGDQAIIREKNDLQYYGGRVQSVEKGSKGKSRMIGQALCKLIEQSNRVLIMGHRKADMDALGAALGIYRMCLFCETEAYIVMDVITDSMMPVYENVRNAQLYNFMSTEKAMKSIQKDTLLVIVDTNRPSYLEAPELLGMTGRVVVIDHHRRGEDHIDNPTLAHIETYASSASELVTEMLEYVVERKSLTKLEAEALLAGITLDTNRFAVKTGVRTFEAAAWLRRAGADTTSVKKYFQQEEDFFKAKAGTLANAEFTKDGFAYSISDTPSPNAQIINAQVADELLDVKGIRASFVAGKDASGKTCISARSLGEINVQVLLEKLGGGGHLNTAGAQVDVSPEEAIKQIQKLLEKENLK